MKAHIELDLGNTLTPEEVSQLTALAVARKVPVERLIFDAIKTLVGKITPGPAQQATAAA